MGILKTILWILLGYYLLKLVARLARPWIRRYAQRKMEEAFRQAAPHREPATSDNTRVGEVSIDKKPPSRTPSGQKVGEYIDFEEID
jgi:hypothetical protein